jgi:exopolysaccharide biosynthesis predicted pyruvyltransferase EpsI
MSENISQRESSVDMRAYLRRLGDEGVIYFRPNPGNAGDAMIAYATFQLFDELGLDYRLVEDGDFDPTGKIVVYGGGGNLIDGQVVARLFLETCHASAKKLVLLPHTVQGHADLLGAMGGNVDLFAREEVSYDHMVRVATSANVMIADDMVFGLNLESLKKDHPERPLCCVSIKWCLRRCFFWLREFLRRTWLGVLVIDCFRADIEKTEIKRPYWNADLSKLFKCGGHEPALAATASWMIFEQMGHYEEVRTNRLHLAIAGALLGMRVKFYANNYYKCRAVYDYSMKNRFPNVEWVE